MRQESRNRLQCSKHNHRDCGPNARAADRIAKPVEAEVHARKHDNRNNPNEKPLF